MKKVIDISTLRNGNVPVDGATFVTAFGLITGTVFESDDALIQMRNVTIRPVGDVSTAIQIPVFALYNSSILGFSFDLESSFSSEPLLTKTRIVLSAPETP